MDRIIREEDSRHAHMQWNPDWNGEPMLCTAHVNSRTLWLGTVMGMMIIDLDDSESMAAFCRQLRGAADHAESVKKRYDTDGYIPVAMEAWYDDSNGDKTNETSGDLGSSTS